MLKKIINFIKYNNTTAIIFTIIFSGMSVSFAASPVLRDSVYSSSRVTSSVDNHLIVSSDLDNFGFNLKINTVTEDAENYYASYSYQTLAIEDYVWKNVNLNKTLNIPKETLAGKDLGLYIAEELSENINYELSYLKRVQELEMGKGELNKVITTTYAGLVGKLLDPKQEVIEGYNPVVPEITPASDNSIPAVGDTPTLAPEQNTESQKLNEEDVRRIIDQYLAEHQIQTNAPAPELPIPSPTLDVGATESSILDLPASSSDEGQIGTAPTPEPAVPVVVPPSVP